ncbi:protein of unknown function [Vibrio tapetis subsp. tapetis]|uniref:Uncharacterized protein n=1 Tax=Vibrio tapetis subsp. tapetis TaxID=1671868 RepID=A0A2N8ZFW5_9VIBR|nr:protein of unknown function [Vibrio tapetis subsp. tapetis]
MITEHLGDTQWHYGAADLPKQQTQGSKTLTIHFALITDWLSKTLLDLSLGLKRCNQSTC